MCWGCSCANCGGLYVAGPRCCMHDVPMQPQRVPTTATLLGPLNLDISRVEAPRKCGCIQRSVTVRWIERKEDESLRELMGPTACQERGCVSRRLESQSTASQAVERDPKGIAVNLAPMVSRMARPETRRVTKGDY